MRATDPFPSKEPVLVRCPCGVGLLLPPAEARTRRFCSVACARAAQEDEVRRGIASGQDSHATPEGRARSNANLALGPPASKERWETTPYYWSVCSICGESFPSRSRTPPLYCTETCRQRLIRAHKLYTVPRTCPICQQEFLTPKHRPRTTCSRSCGRTWAHRKAQQENSRERKEERCPRPSLARAAAIWP